MWSPVAALAVHGTSSSSKAVAECCSSSSAQCQYNFERRETLHSFLLPRLKLFQQAPPRFAVAGKGPKTQPGRAKRGIPGPPGPHPPAWPPWFVRPPTTSRSPLKCAESLRFEASGLSDSRERRGKCADRGFENVDREVEGKRGPCHEARAGWVFWRGQGTSRGAGRSRDASPAGSLRFRKGAERSSWRGFQGASAPPRLQLSAQSEREALRCSSAGALIQPTFEGLQSRSQH